VHQFREFLVDDYRGNSVHYDSTQSVMIQHN